MDWSRLKRCGIVPVVVLEEAERAVPTARALLAGGIDVMEITFRTDAAADSIRRVAEACPEMFVGAGTVLNAEQCRAAADAGAGFIVSPGLGEDVLAAAGEKNIPVLPGCVTPTDLMRALSLGIRTVKFFPAGVFGGVAALKALHAPFGQVEFVPTGGVDAGNMAEYLRLSCVPAVGGSWLCSQKDIREGKYEKITALCREAAEAVQALRAAQ